MTRYPAAFVPVEVTTDANVFRFSATPPGGAQSAYVATLATGTYRSPHDLLAAWEAAVLAATRAGGTWAGDGGTFDAALRPSDGKVCGYSFPNAVGVVEVDWAFDSQTEGLASILGYAPTVQQHTPDTFTAGAFSPAGWWTCDMPVAVDEGDYPDEEVAQTRALSGYRQTSFLSGLRYLRDVRVDLLLARHVMQRAEVIPGESFESAIWPHRDRIRWFADRDDPESGSDYVVVEPLGQLKPARYQDREDVARYVLRLELERLVEDESEAGS